MTDRISWLESTDECIGHPSPPRTPWFVYLYVEQLHAESQPGNSWFVISNVSLKQKVSDTA